MDKSELPNKISCFSEDSMVPCIELICLFDIQPIVTMSLSLE